MSEVKMRSRSSLQFILSGLFLLPQIVFGQGRSVTSQLPIMVDEAADMASRQVNVLTSYDDKTYAKLNDIAEKFKQQRIDIDTVFILS